VLRTPRANARRVLSVTSAAAARLGRLLDRERHGILHIIVSGHGIVVNRHLDPLAAADRRHVTGGLVDRVDLVDSRARDGVAPGRERPVVRRESHGDAVTTSRTDSGVHRIRLAVRFDLFGRNDADDLRTRSRTAVARLLAAQLTRREDDDVAVVNAVAVPHAIAVACGATRVAAGAVVAVAVPGRGLLRLRLLLRHGRLRLLFGLGLGLLLACAEPEALEPLDRQRAIAAQHQREAVLLLGLRLLEARLRLGANIVLVDIVRQDDHHRRTRRDRLLLPHLHGVLPLGAVVVEDLDLVVGPQDDRAVAQPRVEGSVALGPTALTREGLELGEGLLALSLDDDLEIRGLADDLMARAVALTVVVGERRARRCEDRPAHHHEGGEDGRELLELHGRITYFRGNWRFTARPTLICPHGRDI
jgi:hypothetical protein